MSDTSMDFNSMMTSLNSQIGTAQQGIANTAATGDMTDPEQLLDLKKQMDDYSTMMQTTLGIEEALQKLRESIAQSIGQA